MTGIVDLLSSTFYSHDAIIPGPEAKRNDIGYDDQADDNDATSAYALYAPPGDQCNGSMGDTTYNSADRE